MLQCRIKRGDLVEVANLGHLGGAKVLDVFPATEWDARGCITVGDYMATIMFYSTGDMGSYPVRELNRV